MRYLAIDYGAKRTGLAICDAGETIASPYGMLPGQKELVKEIGRIVVSENVQAVILGLPLNMDDSEGPQARKVRAFGRQLAAQIQVPVYFQDERLSSFGAERKLDEIGLTRGKKRARLDAVAAAEILEAFLEQKAAGGGR